MGVTVRDLDPATVPATELDPVLATLHRQVVETWAEDQPCEPPPTPAAGRAAVLAPYSGEPVRLLFAHDGGRLVGHALLELPERENRHLGLLELHVAGPARRRGTGRALVEAAADLLRQHARRSVLMEGREGSPVEALARSTGFVSSLVEVQRSQPIARLDPRRTAALRREAEQAAGGYRVEEWGGPLPESRVGDLARVTETLNDAPTGTLDVDDEVWDVERVRARDRALAVAGMRLHTVLAYAGDGTCAAFTDVFVSEDGTFAWQWGTGVDPAHRGRRLGLLVKAVMVERLRAQEPQLHTVTTWNAESNRHMIDVNEALGYEVVDRNVEWQRDLRQAPGPG